MVAVLPKPEPNSGRYRSDREKERLKKRKRLNDEIETCRQDLFAGEWEGYALLFLRHFLSGANS